MLNVAQRIILVLGTALTVFFLAFSPFSKEVTANNPDYNPDRKSHLFNTQQLYINETKTDYPKNITCAVASGLGTAVLVFVTKTNPQEKEVQE